MIQFEGMERRMAGIEACLRENGLDSLEAAEALCKEHGIDVAAIVKGVQPIAFENAVWAYTLGTAIALKKGARTAADAAEAIGLGLQAFCVPGSVADQRKVGLGHGNLGAMLLREETKCFCFLAGHESFAAAEGAHRHCPLRQQGAQGTPACNPQRSGQGCRLHHLPDQRLHLCFHRL